MYIEEFFHQFLLKNLKKKTEIILFVFFEGPFTELFLRKAKKYLNLVT